MKFEVMADRTRRLGDIKKNTILYLIASKVIAVKGYYTYYDVSKKQKVMILA
jgi:hypothetical protein